MSIIRDSYDFEKKFNHQMDEYSLLSFQSILHFCQRINNLHLKDFLKMEDI